MPQPSIADMLREMERLRATEPAGQSPDEQWAQCRERLIAAFGEADLIAAGSLRDLSEGDGTAWYRECDDALIYLEK